MIEFSEDIFPANIVGPIATAMQTIDPDVRVFKRPLRPKDPQQSIGISATNWVPDEDSHEIKRLGDGAGPVAPTLNTYVFAIQAFVRHASEEEGLNIHAVLSHRVRSVLYTYQPLQLVFPLLHATRPDGKKEQVRRWGVRGVRYFGNEIDGENLYLSTTEFWVETETQ